MDPQARIVSTSGPVRDAVGNLQRDATGNVTKPIDRWVGTFSIWVYLPDSAALILAIQGIFLIAVICLILGFGTRIVTVLAWLGHVSYLHRGMVIYSGMDAILLMLLFYLCFAPAGTVWSLDAWRARRREKAMGLDAAATGSIPSSLAANIVIRLIQLHMCLIYFCAGTAKLQGPTWWNGTAVYLTLMSPEYGCWDMAWLARRDVLWQIVSCLGGIFTLVVEIGLPFLIWNRALHPLALLAALLLHLAVALTTGLGAFQTAMVAGLVAFVRPEMVRSLLSRLDASLTRGGESTKSGLRQIPKI